MEILSEKKLNANQLAEKLGLNYHTITYNMDVLIKNGLVVVEGPRYGQVYYPSRIFTTNINAFKKIFEATTKEKDKENRSI